MDKSVESMKGQSLPIMVSSKNRLFALLLFFIIIREDLTL